MGVLVGEGERSWKEKIQRKTTITMLTISFGNMVKIEHE